MAYDRFLIAPMKTGLVTDIPAWQIPEDAFARLNNAYIHKGIVKKRFGSQFMAKAPLASRLRLDVGTTDGNGDISDTAPGVRFEIGQMFSIGDEIFTVVEKDTPAVMLATGSATVHTYNTTTGAFVITGSEANKTVYFYPADPVMALGFYEENRVNANLPVAFDRQFPYTYVGSQWVGDDSVKLQGSDSDFVWMCNWHGIKVDLIALFISNFNVTAGTPGVTDDPMYSYTDGTWEKFRPITVVTANVVKGYVNSARIILPFKDRLILLNTMEYNGVTGENEEHVNRCRFSHNGSPFPAEFRTPPGDPYIAGDVSNAWMDPDQSWTVGATTKISDGAGYIDAPVEEEIISAEFIKDRLIVYFERSVWELAYTGNQILPFVWQKINTSIGTKSLKSPVPFDKAVLTVGRYGINGCTGTNVSRINDKIEDVVAQMRQVDEGHERICGIRDYFADLAYWTYGSLDSTIFPNKVLIYNYRNDSWGIADDTITAFGYYEDQSYLSWDIGPTETKFRQVMAGNQQGAVFICDTNIMTNEASMQVTNIAYDGGDLGCVIMNHSLQNDDFIRLENMNGVSLDGSGIYKVEVFNDNTVILQDVVMTGTYTGGGRAARVSQIDILSKQWNFYIDKGKNFFLAKIDFAVKKTDYGEITVDYYPSSTQLSMIDSGVSTGSILGDNNLQTSPYSLYPLESVQERLWHPVYFQTEGECVQIRIYLDEAQMLDQDITSADFQLEGLVVHARQTSERLQ